MWKAIEILPSIKIQIRWMMMGKYVIKRILYMVFVFFVMSILLFFLYNMIPSDPARAELEPMKAQLKVEEYNKRYQDLRKQYGLDDPMIVRDRKSVV